MKTEKILEVLECYDQGLSKRRAPACTVPEGRRLGPITAFFLRAFVLGHLRGMIPKMQVFLEQGRREKVMRWLGFIQGVLWVCGVYTLQELKEHNLPTTEGDKKSKESA